MNFWGDTISVAINATLLIAELRAGLLGRIGFETLEMPTREEAEAKRAEEKAINDRLRKLRTKKYLR